jgi:hypothetical protein
MKHSSRLLAVLASALVLTVPSVAAQAARAPGKAPGTEPHATKPHATRAHVGRAARTRTAPVSSRASSWTVEDPSFPFRWDGCEAIPYRVNLAGTSRRNLTVLRVAIHEIADATGFRFTYAGRTSVVPVRKGRGALEQVPDDALYVAWSTSAVVPRLAGNVIGLGGPGVSYNRIGAQWRVESGGVVIDKAAHVSTALGKQGATLQSLLLHELGHAMGLGHSESKANVMYEGLGSWSRPSLGPGDLAGLRDLSSSTTC